MNPFDSDLPFNFDNSFNSDRYSQYRSVPNQQSIEHLFDQAEKALNNLNVPESVSYDDSDKRDLLTVANSNADPNPSQKTTESALKPFPHLENENTERLYTLKEILESIPSDENQVVNWESLEDIKLEVSVVLGDTEMTMENVMRLKSGAVVPLDAQKNDPVTLVVNGQPIAKGEVMNRNGKFCIRITEILSDKF